MSCFCLANRASVCVCVWPIATSTWQQCGFTVMQDQQTSIPAPQADQRQTERGAHRTKNPCSAAQKDAGRQGRNRHPGRVVLFGASLVPRFPGTQLAALYAAALHGWTRKFPRDFAHSCFPLFSFLTMPENLGISIQRSCECQRHTACRILWPDSQNCQHLI